MEQSMRGKQSRRVVLITLLGNLLLVLIKFAAGTISGSSALIAEAFHSGGDVLASASILLAMYISHRPPDRSHHYGHRKIEPLVAVCIAGLLFYIGFELAVSTVENLREGYREIPQMLAIWVTVICILSKEVMFRYTVHMGNRLKNLTLIADAWHHRTDSLILGGVLAGIVGARAGYPFLDPLVGLMISVLILRMAVGIAWQGLSDLMDTAPPEEELVKIRESIMEIPQVQMLHNLKARRNGHMLQLELRIGVYPHLPVQEGHRIAKEVKLKIINHFKEIEDVIIHVNPTEVPGPMFTTS